MAILKWAFLLAGLTCINALGDRIDVMVHPSMVQVEYTIFDGWSQQCVGNLVSSYVVVSANSCFQGPLNYRRLRAGADARGFGGYIVPLSTVVQHEEADLALVRVQGYFPPSASIMPVSIVPQDYYLTPYLDVSLVSWGSTAEGGILSNDYLYRINLVTRSIIECQNYYKELQNPVEVALNNVCVGLSTYGGRDFDLRDAGAPIFYYNVLAAVVSFGVPYAQDAAPVVATAVGAYSNWIVETAESLN